MRTTSILHGVRRCLYFFNDRDILSYWMSLTIGRLVRMHSPTGTKRASASATRRVQVAEIFNYESCPCSRPYQGAYHTSDTLQLSHAMHERAPRYRPSSSERPSKRRKTSPNGNAAARETISPDPLA